MITNTFLTHEGDGHKALGRGKRVAYPRKPLVEVFEKWLKLHSPVSKALAPSIKTTN